MNLTVELIPRTCHGSNVRTLIPNKYWDRLRKKSYEDANYECEICGQKGKDQGYKHDLECHEIWSYNPDTGVQRLEGLISLCPLCHLCKHIGRALAMKKSKLVYEHMKTLNDITQEELDVYLEGVFAEYKEFSKLKWTLDLSILNEEHDIEQPLLEKAHKKRLDENIKPPKKKKYKRKKRSKKKPLGVKKVVGKRPKKKKK
jgi:hypothetical protein